MPGRQAALNLFVGQDHVDPLAGDIDAHDVASLDDRDGPALDGFGRDQADQGTWPAPEWRPSATR
jgi:hypothetical protein